MLNSVGYAESIDVLGSIVEVSLIKGTYTLMDASGETHTLDIDLVEELKYLGDLGDFGGSAVYERDIFGDKNTGDLYELFFNEDGLIKMQSLEVVDGALERVGASSLNIKLSDLSSDLMLLGSIYELEVDEDKSPQFNIQIVRHFLDGETTYFYACNDKENEKIDMIKVIFVGSHLLEEENYARVTMDYDEYANFVEKGIYKEVSPQELQNYVLGVSRNTVAQDVIKVEADKTTYEAEDEEEYEDEMDDDIEEEEEEDDMDGDEFDNCQCYGCQKERGELEDEVCDECGEEEQDCDCDLF